MGIISPVEGVADSGVFIVTLNRGDEGNPLNPDSLVKLQECLDYGISSNDIRVLLLRSNARTFCTGMDLDALSGQSGGTAELRKAVEGYSGLLNAIYTAPKPVIGMVSGEVRAGGVGLACACDILCATPDSSFGLGEALFGLVPANVLPYLLGYRVTPQKARYLALTTRPISGEEAHRLGVVDELSGPEGMERLLKDRIRRLLRCSPEALGRIKSLTSQMPGIDRQSSIDAAVETLVEVASDPKVLTAIREFREGTTPPWFSRYKPSHKLFQEENR